jgi:hypothetical protein
MKRGIQLKQLNKQDLGLLGLPETVLPQEGTDELRPGADSRPLEPGLPSELMQAMRKELEDTLRLLEQVSEGNASRGEAAAADPRQGDSTGRDRLGTHPPKGL